MCSEDTIIVGCSTEAPSSFICSQGIEKSRTNAALIIHRWKASQKPNMLRAEFLLIEIHFSSGNSRSTIVCMTTSSSMKYPRRMYLSKSVIVEVLGVSEAMMNLKVTRVSNSVRITPIRSDMASGGMQNAIGASPTIKKMAKTML